jgi:methionyl-tRNA synthetase
VLTFAHKHWDGRVPEPGPLESSDEQLLREVEAGFQRVGEHLEKVQLRAALREAMALARRVNVYLDQAPWFSVIKTDRQRAATTVYVALRAVDSLKILFAPFIPFSSEKLHRYLGYEEPLFGEQRIEEVEEPSRPHPVLTYEPGAASGRWQPSQLPPGQPLQRPEPLFRKLEDSIVEEERARLGTATG